MTPTLRAALLLMPTPTLAGAWAKLDNPAIAGWASMNAQSLFKSMHTFDTVGRRGHILIATP